MTLDIIIILSSSTVVDLFVALRVRVVPRNVSAGGFGLEMRCAILCVILNPPCFDHRIRNFLRISVTRTSEHQKQPSVKLPSGLGRNHCLWRFLQKLKALAVASFGLLSFLRDQELRIYGEAERNRDNNGQIWADNDSSVAAVFIEGKWLDAAAADEHWNSASCPETHI